LVTVIGPRQRPDVLSEYLADGSAVVYDPQTGLAHPLTSTAAIVWEQCDGTHTAAEMVEALASVFDAPAAVIERDVQALLGQLSEVGLLEPSAEAAA
jgi:hypothetical protein